MYIERVPNSSRQQVLLVSVRVLQIRCQVFGDWHPTPTPRHAESRRGAPSVEKQVETWAARRPRRHDIDGGRRHLREEEQLKERRPSHLPYYPLLSAPVWGRGLREFFRGHQNKRRDCCFAVAHRGARTVFLLQQRGRRPRSPPRPPLAAAVC